MTVIPNRDVRCDAFANDPGQELSRAVGRIGGEVLRLEPQALLGPIYHGLSSNDLIISARWRRFDIDNDGVLGIDQIIEPIAELHALVRFRSPRRAGIGRRDHLRWLTLDVAIFLVQGSQELGDGAGLALRCRPIRFLRLPPW